MKITKADVLHAKTQLKQDHWRPILCRIYTDEGIYGDGEAALAYGEAQSAAFGMVQNLAKLIIGMDPLDSEVIWDKLYRGTFWGQNGGPECAAPFPCACLCGNTMNFFRQIDLQDVALYNYQVMEIVCPLLTGLDCLTMCKRRTYGIAAASLFLRVGLFGASYENSRQADDFIIFAYA